MLIVRPQKYSNVARFINEACGSIKSNCTSFKTYIPAPYNEIAILVYTHTHVKNGEELFYSYGKTYKWERG